ncbi:MAG: hypothetical protein KGI37_00195 [Alphaproteobacteria bacterium]|nr:hypothetical protein [Alphaproteobacteria bacterium]
MNDTFESHESETDAEHAEVHEAPSDYEFADEHSATAEHSEEVEAVAETKGRSPILPIAAAIVGVAALGGVAWWQFSSNTAPAPPSMTAAQPFVPVAVNPATQASAAPQAATPAAQPVEPVTPTQNAAPSAMAPAPVAPVPATSVPVAAAPAAAPETSVAPDKMANVAPSVPPSATPVEKSVEKPVDAAAVPPAATTAAMPAPAASVPAASPSDQARIDALTARMNNLQSTLDQITQQLGQISKTVDAGHNAAADASNMPLSLGTENVAERHVAPVGPAAHHTHHHVTHTASTHRHVAKARHERTKSAMAKKTVTTKWVLRAASPGQAWVATDPTSVDLKHLQVGDTLPGIGRVETINNVGGTWTVVGSKGSVQ